MKDLVDFEKRLTTLLLEELVIEYLQGEWRQWLIDEGVDPKAAGIWSAEVYQVIDEFYSRIVRLLRVLKIRESKEIPLELARWATGVTKITAFEIVEPMEYLLKMLDPYLPPEPERGDEDDDDMPDEVIQ